MKEADAAERGPAAQRPCVGLVGFAELRQAGLEAILGAAQQQVSYELIALSAPRALRLTCLEAVLIDATGVEHLFELLAALRRARPELRLLVLGIETDVASIERVIAAGAKGYLEHTALPGAITLALEVVRDGSVWAPRKVLANLLHQAQDTRRQIEVEVVRFTMREREVLRLLVMGHPNREIAARLHVDEGTIKGHLSRLMRKAGVENRIALSMRALERGWI